MALLWWEGWDSYPSTWQTEAMAAAGYTVGGNTPTVSGANSRFSGGKGLGLAYNGGGSDIVMAFGVEVAAGVFGFAMNVPAGVTATANFSDGATSQFSVTFGAYGQIAVENGSGAMLGRSSLAAYPVGAWCYIEIGATIGTAGGGGAVAVHVDNVPALTLTSITTQASANAWFSTITLGTSQNLSGTPSIFDDMYLCDNSGGAPFNNFLGDVRVQFLPPAGAGALTQFTPSNGSLANWQCADNTNVDDTLYVSSVASGNEDDYSLAPNANASTILAVRVRTAARMDSGTQRYLTPTLTSGATKSTGTAVAMATAQIYTWQVGPNFLTNPNTGVSWTYSQVNAITVGFVSG